MARVLIIGGTGMLGHRLALSLSKNHETAVTIRRDVAPPKLTNAFQKSEVKVFSGIDVVDFGQVAKVVHLYRPDVVINCAGIVKQLENSKLHTVAIGINALFPQRLGELCTRLGLRLILLSTDCVFKGTKGNYTEDDLPDADDLYGLSKLLGEIKDKENIFTIRTSIIGKEITGNKSLIEWFLSEQKLKGYKNVSYTGYTTQTLSKIIEKYLLTPEYSGLYHISSPVISKHDLLCRVNEIYNLKKEITPESELFIDRSLNSERFQKMAHFTPPTWDEQIKDLLIEDPLYAE